MKPIEKDDTEYDEVYFRASEVLSEFEDMRREIAALKAQPVQHVGESSFESWYESYPRQGVSKQVARDAYAAGMGDSRSQPVQPAPLTDELLWELFYENAAKSGFTTKETYTNFARAVEARVRTGGAG